MSDSLHQKILALPSGRGAVSIVDDPLDFEFKVGHLHAKTAAAELALVASEELAAAKNELNAARALLREVLDDCDEGDIALKFTTYSRARSYLDACNTLGDGNG